MLKKTIFLASFSGPLSLYLLTAHFRDSGLSARSWLLLVPAMFVIILAMEGLDWFSSAKLFEKKSRSELILRGAVGGILLLVLGFSVLATFGFKIAFWSGFTLAVILPLLVLIPIPSRSSKHD